MRLYARLISANKDVEEEVTLSFGDMELTCFVAYAPNALREGHVYCVEVSMFFSNDVDLERSDEKKLKITRIGNGFRHRVSGFLHEDKIITDGIVFQDELFLSEYAHLEHEFINVFVDRIDVAFLD